MKDALDYKKYLACMKRWLSDYTKVYRQEWAIIICKKYPKLKDWYHIHFSNKVYFRYKLEEQLQIIWYPDTYYHHDCIQHQPPPLSKEKYWKYKHYWIVVRDNFKSDIIFYNVSSNKNGKLYYQIYIDFIFKLVVKPWIMVEEDFVFEKDSN